MTNPIRILGCAGSLRKQSFNRALLRAAAELAPAGATVEIFELDGIPLYNQDDEQAPPERVRLFKERIRSADAILIVTPEYNYSVPGVLKNALDWASRPYGNNAFDGKPAAIMGGTVGALGTARAQYHLRQCCVALNMPVLNKPEVMVAAVDKKIDAAGRVTDEPTRQYIANLVEGLAQWARRLGAAGTNQSA